MISIQGLIYMNINERNQQGYLLLEILQDFQDNGRSH